MTPQIDTGAIAALAGLLADPAGLQKRLQAFAEARSAAVAVEEQLATVQRAFETEAETAADGLQRLQEHVTERRERVESAEGVNSAKADRLAELAREWVGIRMPHELRGATND